MDVQEYIERATTAMRKRRMEKSDQLTLGELIDKLESIYNGREKEKKEAYVEYDFGSAIPTTLDSWRGSYAELALGYALTGYDRKENDGHFQQTNISTLLKELKDAVGKTFTGWKGGDFVMDKDTPVWVSNRGNSGNTGIIEVVDNGYVVILMTAYCEY